MAQGIAAHERVMANDNNLVAAILYRLVCGMHG